MAEMSDAFNGEKNMSYKKVACPSKEDLEHLLLQHTLKETAKILGSHPNTVETWKKKLGITAKKGAYPIPEGFKEYILTHTRKETAEHFDVNYEMVRSLEKRVGTKCSRRGSKVLEQMSDLPVLLKYFTMEEVAERFGVSANTIENWYRSIE